MKTIIAEKPSVAREIARIVGATKREDGYFLGSGYAVTWAYGHLVQLTMPEGYGIHGFVREHLPILPDTFTLQPRHTKTEKGYKPEPSVVTQIRIVGRLFNESEQIIVATDAGREGELIFRYLSTATWTAARLSCACGSAPSPTRLSERDCATSKRATVTTAFTMPPRHAAKPTGW